MPGRQAGLALQLALLAVHGVLHADACMLVDRYMRLGQIYQEPAGLHIGGDLCFPANLLSTRVAQRIRAAMKSRTGKDQSVRRGWHTSDLSSRF